MLNYKQNPWFVKFNQNNNVSLRVFCFHYAGGNASAFREWYKDMPEEIEIVAVQLPGREKRFTEPLLSSSNVIIDCLSKDIVSLLDKPYVVYGHSVGALLAFELVQSLRDSNCRLPNFIVVSSSPAPQLKFNRNAISNLPDNEFLERLKAYNGLPDSLTNNNELLSVFMPMLRADLTVFETYTYREQPPLKCPIIALGGIYDPIVSKHDLAAWYNQTTSLFTLNFFEGDHFFIKNKNNNFLTFLGELFRNKLFNA
jgi:medium-chain acyl-[acyl-carrier-protein] hydrolase